MSRLLCPVSQEDREHELEFVAASTAALWVNKRKEKKRWGGGEAAWRVRMGQTEQRGETGRKEGQGLPADGQLCVRPATVKMSAHSLRDQRHHQCALRRHLTRRSDLLHTSSCSHPCF